MTYETRSLEELIAAERGDTRRRRALIKMLERVRANTWRALGAAWAAMLAAAKG